MQGPEVDWSVFDDEVTFGESEPRRSSNLHKDTLEPILWQWRYIMGLDSLRSLVQVVGGQAGGNLREI